MASGSRCSPKKWLTITGLLLFVTFILMIVVATSFIIRSNRESENNTVIKSDIESREKSRRIAMVLFITGSLFFVISIKFCCFSNLRFKKLRSNQEITNIEAVSVFIFYYVYFILFINKYE